MASLEEDMSNASTVEWETNRYAKINHAFTNWFSDNYNERADERSWESMKTFLADKFVGEDISWESASQLGVVDVLEDGVSAFEELYPSLSDDEGGAKGLFGTLGNLVYLLRRNETTIVDDENRLMMGFISFPLNWALDSDVCGSDWKKCSVPTVFIQSDGPGGIAKQRALQITKRYGYAAFVADDFKSLTRELIQEVIPFIDFDKVAFEVYGGEGIRSDPGKDGLFKVVSSFHGNMSNLAETASSNNPQVLVFSGVDGDSISDIITLENSLIAMDVNYELNRYSGAGGNFTNWNGPDYNPYAAGRSFEAVESVYREKFGEFSIVHVPSDYWTRPDDMSAARVPSAAAASSCLLLVVAYNLLF